MFCVRLVDNADSPYPRRPGRRRQFVKLKIWQRPDPQLGQDSAAPLGFALHARKKRESRLATSPGNLKCTVPATCNADRDLRHRISILNQCTTVDDCILKHFVESELRFEQHR